MSYHIESKKVEVYNLIKGKSAICPKTVQLAKMAQDKGIPQATFYRCLRSLRTHGHAVRLFNRISVNLDNPPQPPAKPDDYYEAQADGKTSKAAQAIRSMPPLYNKLPDRPYSQEDSEALQYLYTLPEVQQHIPNLVWEFAKKHLNFDEVTKKWTGKNYSNTITTNQND